MNPAVLLLLFQAPVEPAPAPAPYEGAIDQGLAELRELSLSEEHDRATELARSLLASSGLATLPEPQQARVQHDIGVACARGGFTPEAVAAFQSASARAGPGELRLDAAYDAGTVLLEEAERLRLQVPEIAQKLGAPPPAAPPPGAPGTGTEEVDPLETARAAYLAARGALLERLRLDWRAEDPRANLELCARRLRELDEIKREREQQQSEQNQNEQDQKDQPSDPQDKQKGDPQNEPPEDQQGEQKPSDEQPPEDPKEDEKPKDQPQPTPDQPQPAEPEGEPKGEPQPSQTEEKVLTREEILRLLDQLEAIDEQARAVRALLRERRRKPVEKDW